MAWWMAIPIAMQAAGSVANAIGGAKQADVIRSQAEEQARRLRLEHERVQGETTARIGGSGFEMKQGSTQMTYLDQMAKEFAREEDFIRSNAAKEADATKLSSIFTGLTGIGSSIFSYGKMSNWWGKAS